MDKDQNDGPCGALAASVTVAHLTGTHACHMLRMTMLLDDLSVFLRRHLSRPHLQRLWRPDIGAQVLFAKGDKRVRIPKGGATRTPFYDDTSYHPALNPESVLAVGTNGWNWVDQVSEYVTFDLDSLLNHGDGLKPEQLAEIINKINAVPEAEIVRSKSGLGYHVRLYFDPHPAADTHDDHAHNAHRALAWLSKKIDTPLEAAVDMCGAIAWIWHQNTASNGFELIKEAV